MLGALRCGVKWHDLASNADAEPPTPPADDPTLLTCGQVDLLLEAAQQDLRPWLRAFVVLAAATGARTGELCGLE